MSCLRALLWMSLLCALWSCAGYKSREVGEIPLSTETGNISGRYFFSSLEENCEVSGTHSALHRMGDHNHPPSFECNRLKKSDNFLPLPGEAWAHPDTTITLDVPDQQTAVVRLYQGQETARGFLYYTLRVPREVAAERVDMIQIPIPFSGGSSSLEWSISKEPRGLRFVLSDIDKSVFFLVSTRSRFEMSCLLPAVAETP